MMMKKNFLILMIILLIAFVYRIRGLFNPLLDYHSWRQTDTATIAYNFYSTDMNIFKPRLNVFPEIRELEFHIYPYIVAVLYHIFGFHEFIGKLVSIFFGLGTIAFLYLLAKKYFNENVALFSAAFFAVAPMAVYYNRTFMPESTMLFFSITTIYFLTNWLENNKVVNYILSIVSFSLALLTKATSLYLAIPIIYLFVLRKKVSFSCFLYLFLSLLGPFLWYYYQHQVYMSAVGGESIWNIGTDKWFNKNILLKPDFYRRIWLQHLGELHFAYTGYLFFIIGLFSHLKKEQEVFRIWVFAIFFYFIVVAVGNYVHEYYQLPILLPGSALFGLGVVNLMKKIKNLSFRYKVLLQIIMVIFLLWLPIYGYTKSRERMRFCYVYKVAAEKLTEISLPTDKIIVISDGEPEVLYYSKRKGWHFGYDVDKNTLEWCASNGAKYLVYLAKEEKHSYSTKNIKLPKFDKQDKEFIKFIDSWKRIKKCVVNTDFVCIWEIKNN
jgi:4-amino-4-deoxy-L-arabinose transferase-like glycosyltransferase